MIRERFNSLDRGCENGVKTLLQCRKLTCGRFGSKLDGQLCRTSRLRNGAEGMKGFVKRCYARKPETVLNLLRVVMGTQVTVEHVERPKRFSRSCGLMASSRLSRRHCRVTRVRRLSSMPRM
jgi:hypothetical protein